MNQTKCRKTRLLTLLAFLTLPAAALSQTNLETNAWIQFNFLAPGAGNLGLGGAFVAIADDATAAYTNPAGLPTIARPEVHAEARHWRYTHVYTDHGRIENETPTNCFGLGETCLDTVEGLQDGTAEDRVGGLSFLSFVYPRKRWAFALYRHELVNFEANFSTQGAYLQRTRSRGLLGFPGLSDGRLASLKNSMRLSIVNYSLSAGWRVSENLSIGMGLVYHEFFLKSRAERYLPDLLEPPDYDPGSLSSIQRQDGEDVATSLDLGFFWQGIDKRLSLAGAYRQGARFDVEVTSEILPLPGDPSQSEDSPQPAFRVPDVFAMGLAFQFLGGATRISFELDRIEYSDMMEGFVDIFDPDAERGRYAIDDVTEIHLGMEFYIFQIKNPTIVLRFGAWHEPDHSLRYEGDNVGLSAIYRGRGGQSHLTAGFGVSLRNLRIDAAFDYSERFSTASISMVTGLSRKKG